MESVLLPDLCLAVTKIKNQKNTDVAVEGVPVEDVCLDGTLMQWTWENPWQLI